MIGRLVLAGLVFSSLTFVLLSEEPMAMGLGLAAFSVGVAVMVGVEYSSYFGYLVFFVYVGTLVVMFCMVVSMAPNPQFNFDLMMALLVVFWGVDIMVVYGKLGAVSGSSSGLFCSMSLGELSGDLFSGLGVYSGGEWGCIIIGLGLILMLGVVCIANMSKRNSGPLVMFEDEG